MDISKLLANDSYFIYNKRIARTLGPEEAILIGLLCNRYNFYKKVNKLEVIDGKEFFYCTREAIEEETGLTKTRQLTTVKSLEHHKILIIKRVGLPSKNYYHLCFENIVKLFEDTTTSRQESLPLEIRNTDSSNTNTILSEDNIEQINNNKGKVEETSTSYSKNTLESFRKNYTIDKSNGNEVQEVIEHLNNVTGKKYKSNTPDTVKLVNGRLKDGYSVEDMKKVIDHRWQLWKGTDMEIYMRPSTLFRPSKFENYINSLDVRRKTGNRGCPDTLSMFGVKASKNFNTLTKQEQKESLSGETF